MQTYFPVVSVQKVPPKHAQQDRPLVLLVDDDPIINFTLSAILNNSGFAPIAAHDGAEALEIAKLIPPQVLVTDLLMRGMNGLELAMAVRSTVPDCEVILISGQISFTERSMEELLPVYGFVKLCKPVYPTDLLACIGEQLSRRGGHQAAGMETNRVPARGIPPRREPSAKAETLQKLIKQFDFRSASGD